jgi:SagB-type dehydrogenase family enzyme
VKIAAQETSLAEDYHLASRNPAALRPLMVAGARRGGEPPPAPLSIAGAPLLALPAERAPARMALEEVIARRTSASRFGRAPITAAQLATLLALGNGVRSVERRGGHPWYQRNAPSAGNLGSVEVCPLVLDVEGIPPGLYHYDAAGKALSRLCEGDLRTWLRDRVLIQPDLATACAALALTVSFGRLGKRYGLRGYRLGLLDAGHVSENLYLAATALGLAACAAGGFIDAEIDRALGIDGLDCATALVVLVGTRA